jgi:hypothetical protein
MWSRMRRFNPVQPMTRANHRCPGHKKAHLGLRPGALFVRLKCASTLGFAPLAECLVMLPYPDLLAGRRISSFRPACDRLWL